MGFKIDYGTQQRDPLDFSYQPPSGYGNNPMGNQAPSVLRYGAQPPSGMNNVLGQNNAGQMTPAAGPLPTINFGGAAPTGMMSGGWNGFTQQTNADGSTYGGWGTAALGAASGLVNSYMGIKQFGLAKDSLKEGKRQFDLNYGAQKSMVNSRLEDRQRSRVADSGGKGDYDSTSDYMKKYGIQ